MNQSALSPSLWSQSTVDVMEHLKHIRPYDGWSVDIKQDNTSSSSPIRLIRLLRRNVPLTDNYFLDLYYDLNNTRYVVGILTNPDSKNHNTSQGRVLIDPDGHPIRDTNIKIITISSWNPKSSSSASSSRTTTNTAGLSWNSNENGMIFTEEQKKRMMYQFLIVIGGLMLIRIVLTAFIGLYVLALPILIFIMIQQCPLQSSFDAKEELKRVLRGLHLSDNNPNKPKGFFNEAIAFVQAAVATELATLPGYEVTTISLLGAAVIQCVRVPSVKYDFYWIGAFNKWIYLLSKQIPESPP